MLRFTKALMLAVLVFAGLVILPAQAGATTEIKLQEDAGAIVSVASGASLTTVGFAGAFGSFSITGL